jgi:hypothetical protein
MTAKPSQIVAQAAARLRERNSSRLADRLALLEALEGTRPPSPEEVLATIDQTNWSVDELQAALELRAQRREWRATLDREPDHRAAMAEAVATQAAALETMNKAIHAARVACNTAQIAAQARIDAAQAGLRAADDARVKLLETSDVVAALQTAANAAADARETLHNDPDRDLYADRRRVLAALRSIDGKLAFALGERAELLRRERAKEQAELDRLNAIIGGHEAAIAAAQQRVQTLETEAVTC